MCCASSWAAAIPSGTLRHTVYQNVPSVAVSDQRCSPPVEKVLGELREHDLESFLTELLGAHGHAVIFN